MSRAPRVRFFVADQISFKTLVMCTGYNFCQCIVEDASLSEAEQTSRDWGEDVFHGKSHQNSLFLLSQRADMIATLSSVKNVTAFAMRCGEINFRLLTLNFARVSCSPRKIFIPHRIM